MLFANGNTKISRGVLCFSLPPITTCPNHKHCSLYCYCNQAYAQYPTVRRKWNFNYDLAKNFPESFEQEAIFTLNKLKAEVVRVHVSGDFFSQSYVDSWERIVTGVPGKKFYAYTKTIELFDFSFLAVLENFNLLNSICPDGLPNFGSAERVAYLKSIGYHICQGVTKTKYKKGLGLLCGLDCTWCHVKGNDKVAFKQH